MALVSVVMPVFNAERYVGRAVRSVLAQTFGDFEFLVVDDGSTDGTSALLDDFAGQDARVRIIRRPNTGIVGALNDGLAEVGGVYIARVDADDWCAPRRFELQVARLDEEPDLVVLGCGAAVTDGDGAPLGEYPVPLTHGEIEGSHLQGRSAIHHPAAMMRAAAVRQVGGYREGFCPAEDFDLWLRLAEVGRVANLPQRLITKRLTEDGIVGSTLDRQSHVIERILKETWERRGLPGEPVIPVRRVVNRADLHRQWAWMALASGEIAVARKYATRAVLRQPFRLRSWRAMACAIRGH